MASGPSTEMMCSTTIDPTSILPITGSKTTQCKKHTITQCSLQSKMLLKVVRMFFDNERIQERSQHDSLNGVKTSENGLFLYKSTQADFSLRSRFVDYVLIFSGAGFVAGFSQFLILPFAYAALQLPRKYAIMNYFTFHAELLPHTEQVVFHKATFQGKVKRVIVDIKNLEKIDADLVPSKSIHFITLIRQIALGHQHV